MNYLTRMLAFLLAFVGLLNLNACALDSNESMNSRLETLMNSSDEKLVDERFQNIIDVLKNNDAEGIKALFSKAAIAESVDFEANADKLFTFISGNIESWERLNGLTVIDSVETEKRQKEIKSGYYVYTEDETYYFFLLDYPVNTIDPSYAGLYTLLVVKAEDEMKVYDGDEKILYDGIRELSLPGIHVPLY